MGKWIDRTAALTIMAIMLYLLFLSAFGHIGIACCFSLICCALILRLRQGERYRMTKLQAQTILENWVYGEDEDAKEQIASLLQNRPGELVYIPKHPASALSTGDVFSIWKRYRHAERIIIATACYADGKAKNFAATLQSPAAEIIDARKLIPLVRQSSISPPYAPRGRQFLRQLRLMIAGLPSRRPWHRSLLAGLGLMLVYLITGSPAYLALSICTLFIAGISVRT